VESILKKILCPIDFSASSINAMECAAKLSKELNCSLTLWNVCELPILDEMATKNRMLGTINKNQNELSEILQDWCEEIKEEFGVSCGYLVRSGKESVEEILKQYTDGENFDLIITGTNGTDNMYQFFFGTNSYRIIEKVKCPVMIISKDYSIKEIKSVVFATDYATVDTTFAKGLVERINTTIASLIKNESINRLEGTKTFEGKKQNFSKMDKAVHFEQINHANKLEELLQIMVHNNADLVIVSANCSSWFKELYRKSILKKAMDGIRVPVLVFHKTEEEVG
jgi:nucleotide-binding universal stress UspA family protein